MKSSNLRVTSQFYYCSYPLSMDLYSGCPHGCSYCFARASYNFSYVTQNRDYNLAEPTDYTKLLRLIKEEQPASKQGRLLHRLIKARQPIHIGGMADPFPRGVEKRLGHAKNFLLDIGDYPIIWSTKNPMLGEYPELFARGNHVMQISIIGFGHVFEQIERGCISPEDRLERAKAYKGKAKKTIVRMQPYFPQLHNEQSVNEFMERIADSRAVEGVTLESFKMSLTMETAQLSKALGFDIRQEMLDKGLRWGKDLLIPDSVKVPYIKMARDAAHKHGLEFYSSDNATRSLGDCAQCCGIMKDELPEFQSKMPMNWSELVFRLKKEGRIRVNDFLDELPDYADGINLLDMEFNFGNKRGRE